MSACTECGAKLGPKNASGYCRKHFSSSREWPGHGEKISAALRHKFATDPEYRAGCRARAKRAMWLPQAIEARKRDIRKRRLWEKGFAAITPESRRKAAEASSNTKLAWCPPEFRDEYRRLIYLHKGKAEARRIIMERVEKRNTARLLAYVDDAAYFLSVNDRCPVLRRDGEWRYGSARKSSEDIIRMAVRKGWQPEAMAA